MTPEQQRISIAEFCGWKVYDRYDDGEIRLWSKHKNGSGCVGTDSLPDYLHDLNAMHEAEKMIGGPTDYRWCGYMTFLSDACGRGSKVSATAKQRAEALLRTIGKWVE